MAAIYLNIGMSFDSTGVDYVELPEEELVPETHEYFFNALDADLSRLEAYAQNYLAFLDNGVDPDKAIMQRIREELFSLHPFYRACYTNAIATINKAFASFIKRKYPESLESQETAMAKVLETKYLYQADVAYWLDNVVILPTEQIFAELFRKQEDIRRWVFIVLDDTNPDLAKLTSTQRNGLYGLVYGDAYIPLLETKVQKTPSSHTIHACLAFM